MGMSTDTFYYRGFLVRGIEGIAAFLRTHAACIRAPDGVSLPGATTGEDLLRLLDDLTDAYEVQAEGDMWGAWITLCDYMELCCPLCVGDKTFQLYIMWTDNVYHKLEFEGEWVRDEPLLIVGLDTTNIDITHDTVRTLDALTEFAESSGRHRVGKITHLYRN